LEWVEVDEARKEIRLAGERTKNDEEHIIPLTNAAKKLIDALPRVEGSNFVLPPRAKHQSLAGHAQRSTFTK
jgi:integrase